MLATYTKKSALDRLLLVSNEHVMSHGYPRPQLQRHNWRSLNGQWDFAIDADARWCHPEEVEWATTIEVPYAPETPASGVGHDGFFNACWYRRTVDLAALPPQKRLLLHFGAVDYRATVWINGSLAGSHEGGYTPFTIDLRGIGQLGPGRYRRPRRRRSRRPGEAARETGLAARTTFHLVSANDGHLADGMARERCPPPGLSASGGLPISNDGSSGWRRGWAGRAARR